MVHKMGSKNCTPQKQEEVQEEMRQVLDLDVYTPPPPLPVDYEQALQRMVGDLDTFHDLYRGEGVVDVARFWKSTAYTGDQIAHLYRESYEAYTGQALGKVALSIGRCLRDCGHYKQSMPFLEKALAIFTTEVGVDSVAEAYNELGRTVFRLNNFEEAQKYWCDALRIRRLYAPLEGSHRLAVAINNFALVAGKLGNTDAAEKAYDESIAMYRRVLGPSHADLATALHNYALLKSEMGKELLEATELYKQALAMKIELFGPHHLELAMTYNNMGLVKAKRGLLIGAIQDYHHSKEIFEDVHGPMHPNVAMVCFNLGVTYGKLPRPLMKEAEFYLQQAYNIRLHVFGEGSEQVESVVTWFAYWKMPHL